MNSKNITKAKACFSELLSVLVLNVVITSLPVCAQKPPSECSGLNESLNYLRGQQEAVLELTWNEPKYDSVEDLLLKIGLNDSDLDPGNCFDKGVRKGYEQYFKNKKPRSSSPYSPYEGVSAKSKSHVFPVAIAKLQVIFS